MWIWYGFLGRSCSCFPLACGNWILMVPRCWMQMGTQSRHTAPRLCWLVVNKGFDLFWIVVMFSFWSFYSLHCCLSSLFIFFTKARQTIRGNDDIMNFARVFTGFDQQRDRGNMEDLDGQNRIDPMKMKAVWRMQGNLRNPSLSAGHGKVK